MSLKRFLYFILKEDGRSARVVNGVVTYSGQPYPLPQSPEGWQEILLAWERSLELHGLVTNFSLPMGFVRDAARITRDALYKETTETKLFLLIQRLTLILSLTDYNWFYKYFYRGELDLSAADDTQDMINVPIMEGGLSKLIKAAWDTDFEFPLSDPACVNVAMDGIDIQEKANYELLTGFEIAKSVFGENFFLPFTFLNRDGQSTGITFISENVQDVTGLSWADKLAVDNYIAKAADNNSTDIDVHIVGTMIVTCTQNDIGSFLRTRFLRSNQLIANQNDYLIAFQSPIVDGDTYRFDVDMVIPLEPGERLYMEGIYNTGGVDVKIQFEVGSTFALSYTNRYKTTYVLAWPRMALYKALIKRITGSDANAISQLCTDNDALVITCGDAIRGLTGVTVKTSLRDFFKDNDATFMAGMAITAAGVELEDRTRYYEQSVPPDEIDLGIIVDFEIKPAQDLKYNTFKFGHPKQDTQDVNGKYGPNGNNQFTGPLTKDVKEYNMVSGYKADPYEIESLRQNLNGKTTTDDKSDNDVFVLATVAGTAIQTVLLSFIASGNYIVFPLTPVIVPGMKFIITGSASNDGTYTVTSVDQFTTTQTVHTDITITISEGPISVQVEFILGLLYTLDRPAYTTLEGVPNDTIFNLPLLTPKTMLLRHGRWIRSMNAGLDSQKIVFASGKDNQNTELKTVLGSVTVDEDKDEAISGLGAYMFLPWYFIFKTQVPIGIPELIEDNPNLSFKFTDEAGQVWRGFSQLIGVAPNDYTPQEFKLLATPENDILKLIHG